MSERERAGRAIELRADGFSWAEIAATPISPTDPLPLYLSPDEAQAAVQNAAQHWAQANLTLFRESLASLHALGAPVSHVQACLTSLGGQVARARQNGPHRRREPLAGAREDNVSLIDVGGYRLDVRVAGEVVDAARDGRPARFDPDAVAAAGGHLR